MDPYSTNCYYLVVTVLPVTLTSQTGNVTSNVKNVVNCFEGFRSVLYSTFYAPSKLSRVRHCLA